MLRVSHQDAQNLSAMIADLYAPADLDTFAQRLVRELRRLVRGERASYNLSSSSLDRVTIVGDGTPPIPGAETILSRFYHEHPLVIYFTRQDDWQWLRVTDVTTRDAFRRSNLYEHYYRKMDIEFQIAVMFRVPREGYLAITLNRKERDFSERDRAVLHLLLPHLLQAQTSAARLTGLQHDIAALERGADLARVGIVLLDSERHIRLMTPRARRWLEAYFGPARTLGRCLPRDLDDWVAHEVTRLECIATPRRPLVVECQGRRLEARLAVDCVGSTVILTETVTELPVERLEALGLSRREAEVLKWVAEGKRNAEIAIILGISQATVQHHVEHIHQKLGVETRTAAAARARDAMQEG